MKKRRRILLFIICFFIFNFVVSAQIQVGSDIAGGSFNVFLGLDVSLSSDGNTLAVLGSDSLRTYKWEANTWTQFGKGFSTEAHDISLSSNGERIAGIFNNTCKVYSWNGVDWEQTGNSIDINDNYYAAWSVSISPDGSRFALGTLNTDEYNDSELFYSGSVQVYALSTNNWVQIGDTLRGDEVLDFFGASVSMSFENERIAIAAQNSNDSAGKVKVYDWDGSNWNQVGEAISGKSSDYQFGHHLSISTDGNHLIIGTSGILIDEGYVEAYDWNGSNWVLFGETIQNQRFGSFFNSSVSISANGGRIAIGAPYYSNDDGTYLGRGTIYKRTSSNWKKLGEDVVGLTKSSTAGYSIALSSDGNRFALGSPGVDYSERDPIEVLFGNVRVFDVSGTTNVVNTTPKHENYFIYPNPASNSINVSEILDSKSEIYIINSIGTVTSIPNKDSKNIDISHLPDGVYFFLVINNHQNILQKFIKG